MISPYCTNENSGGKFPRDSYNDRQQRKKGNTTYRDHQHYYNQRAAETWPPMPIPSPSEYTSTSSALSQSYGNPSSPVECNRINRCDDSQSTVDFQERIADLRFNNDADDESIGVNRHNYSPESIRRILDQQEKFNSTLCHQLSESVEVDHEEGGIMTCATTEGHGSEAISSTLTSTFSGAAGFFTRWMQVQRIKRQREALEKAVEEQRRILMQQSLSELHPRRCTSLSTWHEENVDGELRTNETFQNAASTVRPASALPFCGSEAYVDDDEEYSYGDESRENFEQYMNTVRGANDFHDDEQDDGYNDGLSYDTHGRDEREGTFTIGNACHTVSGQGVAVQLEILDKPKNLDCSVDTHDQIKIQSEQSTIPFILNLEQMRKISALGLPASITFCKWKRLYCLQRDGDSFTNSFLRKVQGQTRTLLVIQTTKHEIMGGYSNSPWESQGGSIGAAFYGSCQASLFKVDNTSNEVMVYNWSGNNRYVQVCDVHAKLLAFGGGGKDGSFGLCVEDDFSVGTTGRCETFNNEPLCDEERFEILNVECWGFTAGF